MDISHQKKSDALATFKQFKAMAELQFGTPLNELGVIHRLICTHTHTTKMVVERKHRYIVELGLSLKPYFTSYKIL